MDKGIKFVDVIAEARHRHARKDDMGSFEYSFKSEITSIYPLTEKETLYRIRIKDSEERRRFVFRPGQFVMLELPGIGEAPFSISSSSSRAGDVELCIRSVGNLTNFLARVKRGVHVGLRGPFGTSFPMEEMLGQNILLIAGGLGLAPLRSPIAYVQENRTQFKKVEIMYGTKDPSQLLFTYQYDRWRKDDLNLSITVDRPDASWTGPVGRVDSILQEVLGQEDASFAKSSFAIVCGPPVMFKSVCTILTQAGLPMQKMFVSLERRMHCGMGKCCRCNVGSTYTCLKGPVFDYWSVMNLKEAI